MKELRGAGSKDPHSNELKENCFRQIKLFLNSNDVIVVRQTLDHAHLGQS